MQRLFGGGHRSGERFVLHVQLLAGLVDVWPAGRFFLIVAEMAWIVKSGQLACFFV